MTDEYNHHVLAKTASDKVVVLVSKDLHNRSFVATYNCLCESELIKVYHCDVKEILNIKWKKYWVTKKWVKI